MHEYGHYLSYLSYLGVGHNYIFIFQSIHLNILVYTQVFLDVVGAFCVDGTCTDTAPARQVSAGLQLTFAACGVLSILG